jgi:hypothetical protein
MPPPPSPKRDKSFHENYISLSEIHTLPDLLLPITAAKAQVIVRKLQKIDFLRVLFKKKYSVFRNKRTGAEKKIYSPLKEHEQLLISVLDNEDGFISSDNRYVQRKNATALINRYLTYEASKSARRSVNAAQKTKKKLENDSDWEIVEPGQDSNTKQVDDPV